MRTTTDSNPAAMSPLAIDESGNAIALPEDAACWRVRRQTGGRPRHQLDAAKQPMRFPLGYTKNDIEDILAAGAYLLDLVDAKDKYLDLTVPLTIGELRNAEPKAEESTEVAERVSLPATASDVRYVLEANVRSMQLAFQHNERTLAAGLRMAETLRDGVDVLADAQAEILRSVASSRGFLRNSAHVPVQALPPPAPVDEDEEEDNDETDDGRNERLMTFGLSAMTLVNNLVETFRGGARAEKAGAKPGFDLASLVDWRRAAPKPAIEAPPSSSAADMLGFLNELPAELRGKLMTVRGQLSADEQARLIPLVMALLPDDLPAITGDLSTMTVDELIAFFRAQLSTEKAA